ncbi:DUF1285 domain-containing protein [Sphingomonas profundi]|uniref:DUF1285 domain-containing protein n=1 Tax=Alterirhizorhabdus profundi TaxID=2681549 RepID=UPI0012E85A92|nr:DUF1285 domain-containing protein [Sphingomonas profundi]
MPESQRLPSDLTTLSLAEIAQAAAERRLPPVDQWHPERVADSAMRIDRDGGWHHEGAPIQRPAMVRLFSSILRREADGGYALVTPVERLAIVVEDVPFVAVEVKTEGVGPTRRLAFRLNTDEVVIAGPAHALRFVPSGDGTLPYLHVRAGLEARLARAVYYELAEHALDEGAEPAGLWSDGAFFAFDMDG